jgi:carboxypeptidase D
MDGFVRDPGFKYHHYDDMKTFLAFYAHTYPNLTRLYSIGKSVNDRDLWVLEISDNPGIHEPLEPGELPLPFIIASSETPRISTAVLAFVLVTLVQSEVGTLSANPTKAKILFTINFFWPVESFPSFQS